MRFLLVAFLALAATGLFASDEPPVNVPDQVLVTGYVKKPGAIRPRDGLTLTRALEEAGGFAAFGDHHHVRIWKSAEKHYIIVNAEAARRKETADPLLQKGDVVIVDQRYLTGFY